MTILSVIPGLVLFAVAFMTAEAVIRNVPFYERELARPGRRLGTIDGARGVLAFAIFLSHAATAQRWYATGEWSWPRSSFYELCGSAPVALFFMITGFLYWRKAIRAPGKLDWRALARSRLRRIAPLYLVCVPCVLFAVGVKTHWTLQVPAPALFVSVLRWMSLGLLGQPDVNGVLRTSLYDVALWTLKYAWLFYLALPLTSHFATARRFPIVLGASVGLILVLPSYAIVFNFVVGMALAHATAQLPSSAFMRSATAAEMSVGALVLLGAFDLGDYGIAQSLLLAFPFAAIVYGNPFGGLLTARPVRLLGKISYSIYATHGLVLLSFMYFVDRATPAGRLGPWAYWAMIYAAGILVVLVAAFTHRFVEYPFLKPGQRALSRARTIRLPRGLSLNNG